MQYHQNIVYVTWRRKDPWHKWTDTIIQWHETENDSRDILKNTDIERLNGKDISLLFLGLLYLGLLEETSKQSAARGLPMSGASSLPTSLQKFQASNATLSPSLLIPGSPTAEAYCAPLAPWAGRADSKFNNKTRTGNRRIFSTETPREDVKRVGLGLLYRRRKEEGGSRGWGWGPEHDRHEWKESAGWKGEKEKGKRKKKKKKEKFAVGFSLQVASGALLPLLCSFFSC